MMYPLPLLIAAIVLGFLVATCTSASACLSLRPVKGVCYVPDPSDFVSWSQPGAYPPTAHDFYNTDFAQLWGPTGRNDLQDIAKNLGADAVRMYEWKGYYSHVGFLDECNKQNLRVVVPISNSQVLQADPVKSTQWITETVNEAKGHPAVVAWGLSNELSLPNPGACGPITKCTPQLITAAQLIASLDPSPRPIVIVSVFDKGFATPVAIRDAFYAGGNKDLIALYETRIVMGINMYFSEPPSMHKTILHNVLTAYFAPTSSLATTPLIVTEYGRQSAPAPTYSPEDERDVIAAETQALLTIATGNEFPNFLGFFMYQYSDSNLNGGLAMGLKAYSGQSTVAQTPSHTNNWPPQGPYRVDALVPKPAYFAFQAALAGASGPPSTVSPTPKPTTPRPPPTTPKPSPTAPKPPPTTPKATPTVRATTRAPKPITLTPKPTTVPPKPTTRRAPTTRPPKPTTRPPKPTTRPPKPTS